MLEAHELHFSYGKKTVLDGVSVELSPGEIVGLIGTNGCGKTTLLRCLYDAHRPDAGEVRVDGRKLTKLSRREIAQDIAVVVQENHSDLPLTVADSVLLGRSAHLGPFGSPSEADLRLATQALRDVGALDLAKRPFGSLSGGEKQRVLIARAIVAECPYLLMDEPTNHLDIHYQHEILGLVSTLKQSAIIVMHDLNLAAQYCDRLILLEKGKVRANGTPSEVLQPCLLEPIYGVKIRRLEEEGQVQLLFSNPTSHARMNAA